MLEKFLFVYVDDVVPCPIHLISGRYLWAEAALPGSSQGAGAGGLAGPIHTEAAAEVSRLCKFEPAVHQGL